MSAIEPVEKHLPNVHITRRENLLQLLHEFTRKEYALGKPAKGMEVRFAVLLQLAPSLLSQYKKDRNISNKVAAQIECHAAKEPGWLDQPHEIEVATDAEMAFLDLAKAAWKQASARERRRLMLLARRAFSAEPALPPD